jgi:hypothetical protein
MLFNIQIPVLIQPSETVFAIAERGLVHKPFSAMANRISAEPSSSAPRKGQRSILGKPTWQLVTHQDNS